MKLQHPQLCRLVSLAFPVLLSGCALQSTAPPSSQSGASLQGQVHGGQQAVSGAQVYLFAVNTTGYAGSGIAPSTTNLSRPITLSGTGVATDNVATDPTYGDTYVTTDSFGNFSIGGDYTCTAADEVYLYAVGGNTGSGTNSAASFLALLGSCPAAGNFAATVPFVLMNEVTTVASAYALAGFATDALHISSSGSALAKTGVANAFANFTTLANVAKGTANSVNPNNSASTVPQAELDTLANILAACVNSTNTSPTNCTNLFSYVESAGTTGTPAKETATEAIYIAQHPGTNVTSLYALEGGTASPFAPILTTQPNDFTVAITWTGNGLAPVGVAIDASGAAWVTNFNPASLTKLLPNGANAPNSPFTGNGLAIPGGIAIDGSGNVWVTERNTSALSKFTNAGAVSGSSPFTGNGLSTPEPLAIDASGNVWVANFGGSSVSEFTPSGTVAGASPLAITGLSTDSAVTAIAVDASGYIWLDTHGGDGSELFKFNSSGTLQSPFPVTGNGLSYGAGLEFDNAGNAWAADNGGQLSAFTSAGAAFGTSPFSLGSNTTPIWLDIDGASNIWAAGIGGARLSENNSSGTLLSGSSGFGMTFTQEPLMVAVDGSGDVWATTPTTLEELIGAATPKVTPIAANLVAPYGTAAVNRP